MSTYRLRCSIRGRSRWGSGCSKASASSRSPARAGLTCTTGSASSSSSPRTPRSAGIRAPLDGKPDTPPLSRMRGDSLPGLHAARDQVHVFERRRLDQVEDDVLPTDAVVVAGAHEGESDDAAGKR